MTEIKTLAKVALLLFLYYVAFAIYFAIMHPIPALGDSWDYHIPISQTILNGSFLMPHNFKLPQWYYPGSSEAINALFILLHIPLTLSNLFAAIILFLTTWKLALTFRLKFYYALLFATTICTLNVIVRWFNAVSIDIWVAVFFCWTIILLQKPKESFAQYLLLGFVTGMLIGTKYTALFYFVFLMVFYAKSFMQYINLKRFIVFLIPFTIFGLFWYIRNYIAIGNPFYPMPILGFHGVTLFNSTIWQTTIAYPKDMIDALFGEYKFWILVILFPFAYFLNRKNKKFLSKELLILLTIGIVNFILFLFYPTSKESWIMVSSLRYSYPIFIPLILAVFIFAEKMKKEQLLGYFALGNMIMVTSMSYYPKLILFYLPAAFLIFYIFEKLEKKYNIV